MKKLLQEFKTFAVRGNMVDLAVALILGAAFGKIVTSLVNDIIMPPIGLLLGGTNFSDLKVVLREAAGDNPAVTINYGVFIQGIVDFIIVAAAVFLIVKIINMAKRKEAAVPAAPSKTDILLTEIRDLLKSR